MHHLPEVTLMHSGEIEQRRQEGLRLWSAFTVSGFVLLHTIK